MTEWRIGEIGNNYISIDDQNGIQMCQIFADEALTPNDRERAERIVKVMNCHNVLLAACQVALHTLETAQENVVNVGGKKSEEAKFFDGPIKKLRRAIAGAK